MPQVQGELAVDTPRIVGVACPYDYALTCILLTARRSPIQPNSSYWGAPNDALMLVKGSCGISGLISGGLKKDGERGAVCWVADKTGKVHSGEGKLLLEIMHRFAALPWVRKLGPLASTARADRRRRVFPRSGPPASGLARFTERRSLACHIRRHRYAQ